MSGEPNLSDITALDVIEHLNELLAFLMAENRELERTLARRDRQIELMLANDRAGRALEALEAK
jgi:hypothetical protein